MSGVLQRIAGALLILASVIPFHAFLRRGETGLAGRATADMAADATAMVVAGMLFAAAAGIVLSRLLSIARARALIARIGELLTRPTSTAFAGACAAIGCVGALMVARFVFNLEPVLIDATAQLTQARHLADGMLSAPADTIGFFRIQQTVPVADGWTSQYPPGHVIALAAGMRAGLPWLIGPAMLAAALYFTARAVDMLLPAQRALVRAGIVAAAVSPFMLTHAATYMSHTTAAACIGLALYGIARARLSGYALAGLATGAAFATRPLTGFTVGVVLAVALAVRGDAGRVKAVGALVAGALPGALFVALYNLRMFGAPQRFGYDVALGPAAGLGFGIDPWGNAYGIREAVSYTSAELATLSLHLLEAPFPWVAVVGAFLVARMTAHRGERLLCAVALVPLAAGLLYWHHGLFMGPRMLNEYGIVWCVIIAIACGGVVRALPETMHGRLALYSPRVFGAGTVAAALLFAVFLIPQRLRSLTQPPTLAARAVPLAPDRTLVFVHGPWSDRVAMRLAARGWRLDEIEAALRQNSTCAVQGVVDGGPRESLSLEPRATDLPERVQLPRGGGFHVAPGEWSSECSRQVAADTAGVIDPASIMWRVSSADPRAPVFIRDLGPELNSQLLRYDEATAVVLVRQPDGSPAFVPYQVAMETLWQTDRR